METEKSHESTEPAVSCDIEQDFKPKICRSEKTAILFLGTETKDPENILNALSELQDTLEIDMGVLDMADDACQELSEKYGIDRQASQLVVFQNCEKQTAISLEGDYKEQVTRLKEILGREAPPPEKKELPGVGSGNIDTTIAEGRGNQVSADSRLA